MNRLELIEQLEDVQYNIETVERQVRQKIEDTTYYKFFNTGQTRFYHDKEIKTKALAYWKRRFNRIISQLIH